MNNRVRELDAMVSAIKNGGKIDPFQFVAVLAQSNVESPGHLSSKLDIEPRIFRDDETSADCFHLCTNDEGRKVAERAGNGLSLFRGTDLLAIAYQNQLALLFNAGTKYEVIIDREVLRRMVDSAKRIDKENSEDRESRSVRQDENAGDSQVELCFNIWAFVDGDAGLVQHGSAKPYLLEGTEEEKLATLRSLSKFDFYSAVPTQMPERFQTVLPNGETFKGALQFSDLERTRWVEFMMDTALPLPDQIVKVGGEYQAFSFPSSERSVYVLTCVVEGSDGSLVAAV